MSKLVQYENDGVVSTLTLDDGKVNVMSLAMLSELNSALDRAVADKAVVLLKGRQGVFSAGFDLPALARGGIDSYTMMKTGFELAERLLSFPTPVVIACTGHAIAMGAFLILSADVRIGIVGAPAKICVNEVQIGLTVPRFAVEICRQRLAPAHFNRAVITAEPYNPQEAVEAGFLDYVVRATELHSIAHEKAAALSKLVMDAHIATKLRARENTLTTLRHALQADLEDWKTRLV